MCCNLNYVIEIIEINKMACFLIKRGILNDLRYF